MPIVHGSCNSYVEEAIRGVHQESDVYKLALFTDSADLGKETTQYSSPDSSEVVASGYTEGGQVLTGFAVSRDENVAIIDFDDVVWNPSTITARGALIYNSSRGNKAVTVIDFGANKASTNAPFSVLMPSPTKTEGLIRIRG